MKRFVKRLKRLWVKIDLYFTGHWTYCDGCKRFSPYTYCECAASRS